MANLENSSMEELINFVKLRNMDDYENMSRQQLGSICTVQPKLTPSFKY